MKFQTKTEKEIAEENLIPEGIYPFVVSVAEDKKSKAGNDMIELQLRIYMPNGTERKLNDYIMEKMAFKLFHFCAYTGLSRQYEAGTLCAADCVGVQGFAKIGIQADKLGQYPDRNNVRDYCRDAGDGMKKSGALAPRALAKPEPSPLPAGGPDELDEDVPF